MKSFQSQFLPILCFVALEPKGKPPAHQNTQSLGGHKDQFQTKGVPGTYLHHRNHTTGHHFVDVGFLPIRLSNKTNHPLKGKTFIYTSS